MKKTALLVFLLIAALGATGLAEASFATTSLSLDLPANWFNLGMISGATEMDCFMKLDGSMLMVSGMDAQEALSSDIVSLFSESRFMQPLLDKMLAEELEQLGVEGEVAPLALENGIKGSLAEVDFDGDPSVFSVIQYQNDIWLLICTSGVTPPRELLTEVLDCIALSDTGDAPDAAAAPVMEAEGDGFVLTEVPMRVHLDEAEFNIYTTDNDENSLSMRRTEYSKEKMDAYLGVLNIALLITRPDESLLDFNIQIRIKDDKYEGVPSWSELSDEQIDDMMEAVYGSDVAEYSLFRTPTGTFAVFAMSIDTNALRYATIQNGDMIYIHAQRKNGELRQDDLDMLKAVAEAVEFD